ncbi:MAG TPA: pyrroloquinoline quinone-dependent dehydrogenase [Gemmatimonadaceae bacterium]|nr:pyrroloquinoline quinone-dependent dehydrogenase [Gemmatimonadaceae bacterium]
MTALTSFVRRLCLAFVLCGTLQAQAPAGEWPHYGRDAGGTRHSPLTQITRQNVARLEVAWTYHTGELGLQPRRGAPPSLEVTPLVVDGTMYISTPLGRVIALDPTTGRERWRFDPAVNPQGGYGDFTSRGVSTWLDVRAAPGAPCRRRIYIGAIDARLIALDAATGTRCIGFGDSGTVNLRTGLRVPPSEFPALQVTSPPAIVRDLVITGSSIADNSGIAPASGEVRAFDARTGALRWRWDPIPQSPNDPAYATWRDSSAARTGAANVWSVIVADSARDLVFVPTSSPAPDYYGGRRLGANRYANSVVALRASSGAVVWHFQTVHHDLWDYDNASPPALVTIVRNGVSVPAVLQATKTGQLFILHRETGNPIFPVAERPVPRSTVPNEEAFATQPFTTVTPPLSPHRLEDAWGPTDADRAACRAMIAGLRNEGIFTPPSLEGTLVVPSNIGGAHWGGVAADENRAIAVVPVNRVASMVQLIPAQGFDRAAAQRESDRAGAGYQYTFMGGTPYVMRRRILIGPSGLPCSPPPFGSLVAINLRTGQRLWDVPLGAPPAREGAPAPPAAWGSPNLGGPIVTASGLVFVAATLDRAIHAHDIDSGKELWRAPLPASGKATPMTYEAAGRQFIVIAAGGGGVFGEGDAIVAFALPRN